MNRLVSRWWFGDALLLAVCGTIVVLAAVMSPSSEVLTFVGAEVPVMCMFRQVVGLPCPGCGMTRSFVFMAHGAVFDAFRMHALGPFVFALVLSQVPWRLTRLVRGSARRRASAG